jgi:hypothetical protein
MCPRRESRRSIRRARFKAAKSYVFRDPSFGLLGAGCDVAEAGGRFTATLRDGLRKRLRFAEQKLDLEAQKGEIVSATLETPGNNLIVKMADSTALATTVRVVVKGLPPGRYTITYGNSKETVSATDALILEWPLAAASQVAVTNNRTK